ncbi:MAG: FKBP-type peptidyl-prolyl cis-trans isomerase [Brachybacterium sp.]|nr:FKBP-type peptidyl-prolyl cis-trans isomerase [Brachybacterium sp.]
MIRRRTLFSSALLTSAAVGLSACGDDEGTATTTTPAETTEPAPELSETVQVSETVGEEPDVNFSSPLELDGPATEIITAGDGEAIEEGDTIALHTVYIDGSTGDVLTSAWRDGFANYLTVDAEQNGQETVDFLTSATVGSRLLMVGQLQGEGGQAHTIIQVSDVLGKALDRAEGEEQEPPEDLPAITPAEDGAPSLEGPPEGDPPTETQVHVTILGDGESTAPGDALAMHYTGWTWSDGEQFDSSWERGAPFDFVLGQGGVITGWDEGLEDLPVGSQVVLVIPPEDAYGEAPEDNPLREETLVFVADILYAAKHAQA